MPPAVKASVTELPESRVRVDAEVPAEEVQRRVDQAARALGRQMRVPGFRKGKVPAPVVLRRVGRETVLDEAVRGALGRWYLEAISAAGVVPVGDPRLDLGELPSEGQPLTFSIEIGVRPDAKLGRYTELEVGRREPEVPEEAVDRELEALRDRHARLETVERAAGDGDFLVIDHTGTVEGEELPGGEGRDQLVELGAGRLLEGLEDGLRGVSAGETRTVTARLPDAEEAGELAGKEAEFEVTVKEVKAKVLPELDDDFASDAAGFDTLEELRADVRSKLEEADRAAIESEFREAVVDAAAADADVELPDALIESRARELWEQLIDTLQRQGVSKESYLRISGKGEEQLLEEAKPDAERSLRREALLAAVVEKEGVDPTDEDLLATLAPAAEREHVAPEELVERLRNADRLEALRQDVAARQAVDLMASSAKPIPMAQARAREEIWTPEKGDQPAGKLWTPGG